MQRLLVRRYSKVSGDALNLEAAVKSYLSHPESSKVHNALMSCASLDNKSYTKEASSLLGSILELKPTFPHETIRQFFCKAGPKLSTTLLKHVTSQEITLPESMLMIPFRRAIYTAEFREALNIMDLVASDTGVYAKKTTSHLRKVGLVWLTAMGSVLTGTNSLLASGIIGVWSQRPMILGMVATYLTSLSAYGMLSLGNARTGSLGDILEWVKGTSLLYRYRHSREMRMATVLADVNRSLPENRGEVSLQLLRDLRDRQLQAVETADEAHLKEFWARGGAGFEWVEPDQDPADLRFMKRMQETKYLREGSPYSRRGEDGKLLTWAEDLAKEQENKFIPHASLLHVDELKTPERLNQIETELAREKGLELPPNHDKFSSGQKKLSDK